VVEIVGTDGDAAPLMLKNLPPHLPSPATKHFKVSQSEIGRSKPIHVQKEKRRPGCPGRRVMDAHFKPLAAYRLAVVA
jgi:hypothetical protein